ncbi:3-deoxy-D-arabino-heptulosonate 7-phosphate synthase [Bordetella genomosp. 13]|uniref:3-deoxy-D-arabino-heptulosonate 7-phosphate synthase n=1 Tax=Bordetella genomosp. 13 TaxID=463040 RepID=UPI0011A4FF2A|nr:3-deoxy-D-arabino-heptulosonate 7-phosphate synthase [Bordetella genomosp. 13]
MPVSPLLDQILGRVERRYRLPAIDAALAHAPHAQPATRVAVAIEQARQAVERGLAPDDGLRPVFIDALAALIQEAMRARQGDPAFQAMVLRHRTDAVREYASLAAHAESDRRTVRAAVNAVAHPAKLERLPSGPVRGGLHALQAATAAGHWPRGRDAARRLSALPALPDEAARGVDRLLRSAALDRLERLDALAADAAVRDYLALAARRGPAPGSAAAAVQGQASRQRGEAVEASTARALRAVAQCLNHEERARARYRVVTSMRVPAAIPASHDRAKTEWDAVLLRHVGGEGGTALWDICLLAEAKASADAATTDLPRLLRGLRLLAHAEAGAAYAFETREGPVRLRGASLAALRTDEAALVRSVLYCCEAPAEAAPRLLGAASRMQLLCAPPSLDYAAALARGQADPAPLGAVWDQLAQSARWGAVLHQYPAQRQVRNLMVRPDDLQGALAAVSARSTGH